MINIFVCDIVATPLLSGLFGWVTISTEPIWYLKWGVWRVLSIGNILISLGIYLFVQYVLMNAFYVKGAELAIKKMAVGKYELCEHRSTPYFFLFSSNW